jgi:hypothetical protein
MIITESPQHTFEQPTVKALVSEKIYQSCKPIQHLLKLIQKRLDPKQI